VRSIVSIRFTELAAIDRHAGFREQARGAAERDEPGANLADGTAIILAEVGRTAGAPNFQK
jgi:hypothetical protein